MKKYVLALAIVLLHGCSTDPWTRIESNAASDYKNTGKAVYVLSYLQKYQEPFDSLLNTELQSVFTNHGYTATYVSSKGLELSPSVHVREAVKMDSNIVVIIAPAGGTRSQYGLMTDAKYEVRVVDVKKMFVVFKAQIEMHPRYDFWAGLMWDNRTARKLANDIFNALRNGNVI